ncbi:MAG: hypothetical protein LBD10_07465 [Desulfobulbus sp.]|jgi:hypothetical protein|uniref:hypothetical protein n=1 Tax=Desulfobulbus sp. TaxID=895 RepID=UPI00283FE7D5|nr:hypothetical protein [Desulfobulbus sp.]MDR2550016.1 hypothetical protein [Desulfobulbus sp.]
MIYSTDDLRMMLERSGGAVHVVDGTDLFCLVKGLAVEPDDFGRVQIARQELSHIAGDTFERSARHDTEVDGVTWSIVAIREKLSGLVVWTMERETA